MFLTGEVTGVCGIATQGRANFTDNGGWYVKTFRISHSKDGKNWSSYRESEIDKVKLNALTSSISCASNCSTK